MAKRGKSGKNVLKPKLDKSERIKAPEISPEEKSNPYTPLFSFEYLDQEYCLELCEPHHKVTLIERLRILGSLTWQVISDSSKEQHGFEMIPFGQIQGKRPSFLSEDVTNVMVFRFHGTDSRLAGHRVGRVFHIIYIDPFCNLYEH